jgi:hypothetical protein
MYRKSCAVSELTLGSTVCRPGADAFCVKCNIVDTVPQPAVMLPALVCAIHFDYLLVAGSPDILSLACFEAILCQGFTPQHTG